MKMLLLIQEQSVNNFEEIVKEMKKNKMILIIKIAKGCSCKKRKIMNNLYKQGLKSYLI